MQKLPFPRVLRLRMAERPRGEATLMGAPGCPTPAKKGYKTHDAAKRHMWGLLKRRAKSHDWKTLNVYRCACGMYHVGHGRRAVL